MQQGKVEMFCKRLQHEAKNTAQLLMTASIASLVVSNVAADLLSAVVANQTNIECGLGALSVANRSRLLSSSYSLLDISRYLDSITGEISQKYQTLTTGLTQRSVDVTSGNPVKAPSPKNTRLLLRCTKPQRKTKKHLQDFKS